MERRQCFAGAFDDFRSAVVLEPRGSDAVVGALLCEPEDAGCVAGVIFFNNRGYLNMCGHGTIGLAVTLAHMGRISPGLHRIETPVGVVEVDLIDAHTASVRNVASYRYREGVAVEVSGLGRIQGDIAWGGNWCFLIGEAPCSLELASVNQLSDAAGKVAQALRREGITGKDGAEIDHIEFFGPAVSPEAQSRNFVLRVNWSPARNGCRRALLAVSLKCPTSPGRGARSSRAFAGAPIFVARVS
jgi:4-hydroxyproline epimerase